MLKAVFDDSGTHGGSSVIGWAAWVADQAERKRVEAEWMAKLGASYSLPYFHSYHCSNGVKPFDQLTEIQRDALIRELSRILAFSELEPISITVDAAAWASVSANRESADFVESTARLSISALSMRCRSAWNTKRTTKMKKVFVLFATNRIKMRRGCATYLVPTKPVSEKTIS